MIQASYNGDATFSGSSASISFTVDKNGAAADIRSNANPSVFGQPVTFISNVASNPSGR
jgi:hypothetical protein